MLPLLFSPGRVRDKEISSFFQFPVRSLVACHQYNHWVELFSLFSPTGCGPAVFELWAFFPPFKLTPEYFIPGCCLPGLQLWSVTRCCLTERVDHLLLTTNIFARREFKVLLTRFSFSSYFYLFKPPREWLSQPPLAC